MERGARNSALLAGRIPGPGAVGPARVGPWRRSLLSLLGLLGLCLACAAPRGAGRAVPRFEFEHAAMGTRWRIVTHGEDGAAAEAAAAAAFARVDALERVLTDYDETSEARRLVEREVGVWHPVSEDLHRALARALAVGRASGGAFDVTLGPCTRLWRRSARQGELPDPARLAEARARCGLELVELRRTPDGAPEVRLGSAGMRLDFGGIGKGVALDAALDVLEARGFPSSLVDGGGDLALGAPPPGRPGWRVTLRGLADARGDGSPPVELELYWCGVATSGDEAQFAVVDGVRYGHVLDPATGLGVTERRSASVVAYRADLADAWASVLCVDPSALERLPAGCIGRVQTASAEGGVVLERRSPEITP